MLKNSLKKQDILQKLSELKPLYLSEGIEILGLFGSYARDEQDFFSDIDIAYKLDHKEFSKHYDNGFAKLLRLEDVKKELSKTFKKKIDFVPDKNEKILKGLIHV